MLDLKFDEFEYEGIWTDDDGVQHYYFNYPEKYFESFHKAGIFKERDCYEVGSGPIVGICFHIMVSPDGCRELSVSPTCETTSGDCDVDCKNLCWTDVGEGAIETLINIGKTQQMNCKLSHLIKLAANLEETAAGLKMALEFLRMDFEKECK